jgi:hypothetical protein
MLADYVNTETIFSATGATVIAILIPLYFLVLKDLLASLLRPKHKYEPRVPALNTNFEKRAASYPAPYRKYYMTIYNVS